MKIIPANVDDIPTIQQIACLTWPVAYSAIITPRQMEYMLNMMYSQQVLTRQIKEEGHLFYLLHKNEQPIGFAGISRYKPEVNTVPSEADVWKLHKLYLLPETQGTGAGKLLMDFCLEEIKKHGGNYIVLNVNRENKAFHFYQKKGFQILQTGDFDIGAGFFMKDHVMGMPI